jgi:CubicO group peptidase (beta-lactamase class C family)
MTKLMTSVAVLKVVELNMLDLDTDLRPMLPEMGKHGIITGFDDALNTATLTPNTDPITLHMLLSHLSGHKYDWVSPYLAKWRAARGETLGHGSTVADKAALPLTYPPGKGWAYSVGNE